MNPGTAPAALAVAEAAARQRLLNAFLREARPELTRRPGEVRIELGASGGALVVGLRWFSESGHHLWGDELAVDRGDGPRPASHDEIVAALLDEVDALAPGDDSRQDRRAELTGQIANSVARTARYLAAPTRPEPSDAHGRTRHAEQSLRFGHPFHPTPKSAEGFDDADLARYAPELGGAFTLHHLAVAPDLVAGRRVLDGPWTPDDVAEHAPDGWPILPVHPFQDALLRRHPTVARLVAEGGLVPLGPRGREVYATSSVRTVCAPGFPTAWKLPLRVRITNFVRTTPVEHAQRATDASSVVAALRDDWAHPGFGVLTESGWRGVDPAVVGPDLAADLTVLYRDNPFPSGGPDAAVPRVLAGLVEDGPRGEAPMLLDAVRTAGGDVRAWLRAYLRISLLPMLAIFGAAGIGFEAHLQNSLLETREGWPTRFWVRDMEGTHVSAERRPEMLDPASPLVYSEEEAWQRLRYHAVVNQLASVVAVLGRHTGDEVVLWLVVAATLSDLPASCAAAAPYAEDLLAAPALPAKANLISRFAGRSEDPAFVDLPNPIRLPHPTRLGAR